MLFFLYIKSVLSVLIPITISLFTSVLYLIYFHQSYRIYCAILDRRINPIISYIMYHHILRFQIFQSVWTFWQGPGVDINGSAPHWTGFSFWNCIPIFLHYQKIMFGLCHKKLDNYFQKIQVNYCYSVYWEILRNLYLNMDFIQRGIHYLKRFLCFEGDEEFSR